jgi:hypothetical protein
MAQINLSICGWLLISYICWFWYLGSEENGERTPGYGGCAKQKRMGMLPYHCRAFSLCAPFAASHVFETLNPCSICLFTLCKILYLKCWDMRYIIVSCWCNCPKKEVIAVIQKFNIQVTTELRLAFMCGFSSCQILVCTSVFCCSMQKPWIIAPHIISERLWTLE